MDGEAATLALGADGGRDLRAPLHRPRPRRQAEEPGAWAFHCHILNHAEGADGMFGMVTALIVEE